MAGGGVASSTVAAASLLPLTPTPEHVPYAAASVSFACLLPRSFLGRQCNRPSDSDAEQPLKFPHGGAAVDVVHGGHAELGRRREVGGHVVDKHAFTWG